MKNISPFVILFGIALSLCHSFSVCAQAPVGNFYNKASTLFEQKEYTSAIVFYELALQNVPQHPKALLNLGLSNYYLDKYHAAIKAFDQLIQLKDNDLIAVEYRANAYIALEEYESAIKDYNKIIDIAPGSIPFVNRANAKLAIEDFDAAMLDFNQALKYDARDSEALAGKADIYYQKGHYEKARDFYTQSISIYNLDASVYNNRANTFQMLQLMQEALSDYNQAIALEESSASYTNRGKYHLRTEAYDEAALDCIQASLLDFQNADAYHCAGLARLSQNKLEDAFENFDKAVELEPDWAIAMSDLGWIKLKLGNYTEAYIDLQRASELDPHNTDISERLRNCQKTMEENGLHELPIAEAEEDEAFENEILSVDNTRPVDDLVPRSYNRQQLRIATIMTPQFAKKPQANTREVLTAKGGTPLSYSIPQRIPRKKKTRVALFEEAVAQNKAKDYQLAVANFNQILMDNIADYEAYNGRGIALYGLGEVQAAMNDFNRAIALQPNFMEALYNRGRSHYFQGKIAEAIEDFSLVIQYQPQFANAYRWRSKCYAYLNYSDASVMDYRQCKELSPTICK